MASTQFPSLPGELRAQIWEEANAENIIEIVFTMTPTYQKARKKTRGSRARRAAVVWKYRCYERNRSPLLQTSFETRQEYERLHPDTIQLNRGLPIRFNGAQDTVYLDVESLFSLWYYVNRHRLSGRVPLRYLQGFPGVQTLGTHHAVGTLPGGVNTVGLRELRTPREFVLTGLTNIRTLGLRGILPGGVANLGPNPAPMLPLDVLISLALRNSIRTKLITLRDRGNLTAGQRLVVDNEFGIVANEVLWFETGAGTPFTLPIGP